MTTQISKMSATEKRKLRITIAKDVISQLECGNYTPDHIWFHTAIDCSPTSEYEPLKDRINTYGCHVCAIGAVLASLVRLRNNITVSDYMYDGAMSFTCIKRNACDDKTGILSLFSKKQLSMIEYAYEYRKSHEIPPQWAQKVSNWRSALHIDTPKAIQIAIFQNIIDNDGKFKP